MHQHLKRLAEEIARAMRINLEPADLSVEEWSVLSLLSDDLGHPMAEIASAAAVPGPTATRLVDRLTGRALLHRSVDPADGRRVLVALAPRGRELHDRLLPAQRQITAFLAEHIGGTAFAELFDHLIAATAKL